MDPNVLVKRERRGEAKRAEAAKSGDAPSETVKESKKESWKESGRESGRGYKPVREEDFFEPVTKPGRSVQSTGKGSARSEEWDSSRDYERERED